MKIPSFLITGTVLILTFAAHGQEAVDENALFSDTSSIVSSASVADTQNVTGSLDKKSVGFSGSVTSVALGSMNRPYFTDNQSVANTAFTSYITSGLILDARLTRGFKAYASGEVFYWPVIAGTRKDSLRFAVPELFVDANIGRSVYLRTGKQVLQWGRCYLWNPTDLVNVEKRSFIQKVSSREGTFGVKMHVPFQTVANAYGFLGTNSATRIDSVYGAGKIEGLIGNTEMALSVWKKKGYTPVLGFDISSKVFTLDVSGEVGLHPEYYLKTFNYQTFQMGATKKEWVPRISLGLGRSFDLLDVKDRIMIITEFYYNGIGDTHTRFPGMISSLAAVLSPEEYDALRTMLLSGGIFEMNNFSRWYCAAFGTVSKFIISDMSLSLNAVANLNQGCMILSTGVTYRNLSDFSLGLNVNGYIGRDNTEYAIFGQGMDVQVTAGVVF